MAFLPFLVLRYCSDPGTHSVHFLCLTQYDNIYINPIIKEPERGD